MEVLTVVLVVGEAMVVKMVIKTKEVIEVKSVEIKTVEVNTMEVSMEVMEVLTMVMVLAVGVT